MATVEGQTMMHFILSLVIASLLFSCPCLDLDGINKQTSKSIVAVGHNPLEQRKS